MKTVVIRRGQVRRWTSTHPNSDVHGKAFEVVEPHVRGTNDHTAYLTFIRYEGDTRDTFADTGAVRDHSELEVDVMFTNEPAAPMPYVTLRADIDHDIPLEHDIPLAHIVDIDGTSDGTAYIIGLSNGSKVSCEFENAEVCAASRKKLRELLKAWWQWKGARA